VASGLTRRTLATRDVQASSGAIIRFEVYAKDQRLYVSAEEHSRQGKQGWSKLQLLGEQKGAAGKAEISVDEESRMVTITAGERSIRFDLRTDTFVLR
jgi:hypothetical protein